MGLRCDDVRQSPPTYSVQPSGCVSVFTELCNHHQPILEHFHTPKRNRAPFSHQRAPSPWYH